ncbi:MAG: permease prefix domain 1-containing protein [Planctomycetes bacterium]|nr:permease prefix domain 1-containing protein [Planctomycetota bacterium]
MTDDDPIQTYLMEFARRLPSHTRRAERAVVEIEDHLRERAEELCRKGMDARAAAKVAIEQFGDISRILRQFELQAPLNCEEQPMLRNFMTAVAALTTLFAGMIFVFSWLDDAGPTSLAAKLFGAVVIIAYNIVLLARLWTRDSRLWMRWVVSCGGLLLIAIGSAGFVWTAHLGLATGDWESYGFVAAALLVIEGVFAALYGMVDHFGVPRVAA